jgi:hypothetical protein
MGFAMCVVNLGIVPAITSVIREKRNERIQHRLQICYMF